MNLPFSGAGTEITLLAERFHLNVPINTNLPFTINTNWHKQNMKAYQLVIERVANSQLFYLK